MGVGGIQKTPASYYHAKMSPLGINMRPVGRTSS
jgi:hypothetical protein